jgi:phosphoenolpyruvate-protein kinase (PTS system EI component)
MAEQRLTGLSGAPGTAAGRARVLAATRGAPEEIVPATRRAGELERARGALAAAGAELEALAARLRDDGRLEEADVVATGALMAADPALDAAVERHTAAGRPAAVAVLEACGEHADAIAALGDERLAARAEDVRSLGRRAARLADDERAGDADSSRAAARGSLGAAAGEAVVLVADDLGPADVAELDAAVVAIALAAGAPTGHAAVVARGLGIPLAVRLGPAVLDARPGDPIVVDGEGGTAVLEPSARTLAAARADHRRQAAERARAAADRTLPAVTRDGRRVRVLVNAATLPELEAGLAAGAEGVGLLRTELAFLDAPRWPDEAAHRRLLAPLLARLARRTAAVRVLDFGGDKAPPFLNGTSRRGLALLLDAPDALAAQLRAIVAEGAGTDLRILLPIAERAAELHAVRALLPAGIAIGAMVETVAAVDAAAELAEAADFLSIGTNDLAHAATGSDRFAAGAATPVHDPRVLALVARTADAARAARVPLEICGEAASDPVAVPLLVGLGVDELSVGAARVGPVRAWVRALDHAAARRTAREALALRSAAEVEALVAQAGDAAREGRDGRGSIVAVGPQA